MPSDNIFQFPKAARPTTAERLLIPERLKEARRAARLSQVDLANLVGVTRQAVSAYERGDKWPEPSTFARIMEALDQPVAFFTNSSAKSFGPLSTRFFRKVGTDTVRRNEACSVLGDWFVQTARYFDDLVNYPAVDLPEFEPSSASGHYSSEEIDQIAASVRTYWGLGSGPISNVLALVESHGAMVCRYEISGENIEAFSFWSGSRPFIFMATEKEAGVRRRFDAAHELGHLVLHRWVEQSEIDDRRRLKIIESEANRFAGAFLLPSKSFPNEVYTTKLDAFISLKRRWKVSIQAMLHRCKDLGLIDDDQHLNLYKQISFRGWRKAEPLDDPGLIPIEEPQLLKRAVSLVLDGQRRSPDDIVNEIRLNPRTIECMCGLDPGALSSSEGGLSGPTLR